ncbi:hypothetical protein OG921_18600 [Aldersonia sp. NBC_00410]|uniref:hypothetical protein n=1 Tax=Aldersonia sp. NBC_00410 TaxID=2975954 RepID=UPI00225A6351|nr:hypothetical protein [Aldersonia sp. NBC_00410]MCX5045180.1 hypothetical protein [Aldersonia sp. NBC_00410]
MTDEMGFEIVNEPGVNTRWAVTVTETVAATADGTTTKHLANSLLEIEQTISDTLRDRAGRISRTVHRLGHREVYFEDGTRIEFDWEPVVLDWRCLDCGVDTDAIDEYYMVHDALWREAAAGERAQLCIDCLEARLGRTLTAADFTDAEVNSVDLPRRSQRLRDRLTRRS